MPPVDAEELYRLYHIEGLSQAEIGEKFGVTQSSVSKWMNLLGIDSKFKGSWTKEEVGLLEEKYPGDKSEISPLFPERTWNAIKLKAMGLGLARDQESYRHSKEVADNLRELSEQKKIKVAFENKDSLSYVLGVVDGDGYDDSRGTVGLEVKDREFANKFINKLEDINLNPNSGSRRGKITVWASSQELVKWLDEIEDKKLYWVLENGDAWSYIEGLYDSDGNLHPSGSPRICSYNEESKELIHELFSKLGIKSNIQQNNVWVSSKSTDKFFEHVEPVLKRRQPG